MAEVVIVGAGPAGTTLALLLVQRGIRVTLVEASSTFQRIFRGEGLMPSALEALEQMGLSSLLQTLPHRSLDAWEVWINGRSLFRVDEPLEPGGRPCTLVSQAALLEELMAIAKTYPQFTLLQGIAVRELRWRGERVSGVTLANGQELTADLVIGTDGRNSLLRDQANLSLQTEPQSFDILWFKLADGSQLPSGNIFYSIVQGSHTFGLFRSSEGYLQVGWALPTSRAPGEPDWKQVNWEPTLAAASPPWLAQHIRTHAHTLENPVLLSVNVGRCARWWLPGLLLLGDTVHPMSPIRAQGINMALRDAIVAANWLVPRLHANAHPNQLDAVLPQIQAEREPEIVRVQQLQAQEAGQAELLARHPALPWMVSQLAPVLRYPIRYSWMKRQRQLRQGMMSVQLTV